ncbi:MAG: Stk1 family PASTA domain-containing Ser/Thr kinase [Oscillospiraceae bacterium]|nr:Stk1 family PASTA domain-containing Ser/Thr kinase [Oscillospiraceae bacterium]
MDQYIGKMLDNRYEILERIGTGGMAVVYKAKCHRLNRLVAVKILKSDLAQDADFRRRFNAESQAVAQLSHPNIVSVYDVSKGGDIEYIVMELIDGITLKQYMEKRGQLNWRESLHFITQIMRGLSHAHSRGIVHRDIKPQNIMVLRDGSVKVADFGIACLENSAQTLTQEALGSVHYISPEQARGDRTDARSDIYSAGVVLYEMLAGRLPFEGDSAVSVAIQHLSSIPLAPREINPEIPEQLELICMKAMAPDLERRYFSADAMIADLEAFRKNPGVSLDFEMEDLRPEEEDEPTQLLRTSAVTAASNTGRNHRPAPSHERERRREYDGYDEPERRGNRGRTALVVIAAILAVALAAVLFKTIFASFGAPDTYVVPNVVGYTVEEAGTLPDVQGTFTLSPQEERQYSDEYPADTIIRQSPEEGDYQKGELVIKVWLSAGPDTGVMPEIADGKTSVTQAKARMSSLIDRYGLTFEEPYDEEYNDEIPVGCIISSIPDAGEELKKGQTIHVVVSKGPQPVSYIPLTGMQLDLALQQLERLGLVVDSSEIEYVASQEAEGTIISQDPDPTAVTSVPPGTKVKLVVSAGPNSMAGSDTVMLPLPMDKISAHLVVYQDNEKILDEDVPCASGTYPLVVYGSGEVHIVAYLDGEEEPIYDHRITIDAYYD